MFGRMKIDLTLTYVSALASIPSRLVTARLVRRRVVEPAAPITLAKCVILDKKQRRAQRGWGCNQPASKASWMPGEKRGRLVFEIKLSQAREVVLVRFWGDLVERDFTNLQELGRTRAAGAS